MLALVLLWRATGFTLGTHVRKYVGLGALLGLIVAGYTFAYSEEVIEFLIAPAKGRLSPFEGRLVYTGLTSSFGASIILATKTFLITFVLVLTYGLLGLAKRLIPYRWWAYTTVFLSLSLGAFITGLAFFYYVVLGVMTTFLLDYNKGVAVAVIDLNDYLEEITQLGVSIGFVFVLPIVVYLLGKGNVITYHQLSSKRLHLTLGLLAFAVFITPSIEGTLTFSVFIPMYALFEVGVLSVWVTHRHTGNYFADFYLYRGVRWLVIWILQSVIDVLVWIAKRPHVGARWAWRKLRDKIRRLR